MTDRGADAIPVAIRRLPHADGLPLPAYATAGAAGADLAAAIEEPMVLAPGERAAVPTGLMIALPDGFEAQVRPRSGLAVRDGITVLNAPGTIDADFRGEIMVPLVNLGQIPVTISRGMRIAQLVLAPVSRAEWREDAPMPPSSRGAGGLGSTGSDSLEPN